VKTFLSNIVARHDQVFYVQYTFSETPSALKWVTHMKWMHQNCLFWYTS